MNPLVLELATEAKIQMCSEPRLQQFAELVARRCMQVAMDWDDVQIAVEIAELFGVKE